MSWSLLVPTPARCSAWKRPSLPPSAISRPTYMAGPRPCGAPPLSDQCLGGTTAQDTILDEWLKVGGCGMRLSCLLSICMELSLCQESVSRG